MARQSVSEMARNWTGALWNWRLGLTLSLAGLGGWLFHLLHLPLPWMLGAMVVTMLASILGLPLGRTRPVRQPFAAVLGVALGAAFTPQAFEQGAMLLLLIPAIALSTILCGLFGYHYLRRIAGFDPITAYFAAMPAGIQEMTLQGGQAGGDERRIALIHACRIFLLVLVVTAIYGTVFHVDSQSSALFKQASHGSVSDWLVLVAVGVVGWVAASALCIPNPAMLGPLIISAVAHLCGLSSIAPPPISIVLAQVVIGSSLGSNFIGTRWSLLGQSLRHGLVLVPVFATVCLVVTAMAAPLVGVEGNALFLGLAPGGTSEMSLIALALHANVAMVASCQLVRILLVNIGATALFQAYRPKR
jgi:membrane AbrB-like protein